MYKVGQEIWFIEFEDDIEDYSCADIACCLYMAGCDNYIIATSMYFGFENDFESQLKNMYWESLCDGGISLYMLDKGLVFATREEAENKLRLLQEGWYEYY